MNGSIGGEKTVGGPEVAGGGEYALRGGEVLGPYRVVRPLGRGGMGEVYLAEHGQLGTRVALKIIRPEFSRDPGFIDRFQREARLMARLKHSNIVPCRDAGFDRGMPWLAMEFIAGPRGQPMDLFELLAERRESGKLFEEDEAIAVGLQICDALAYAHCYRDDEVPAGILHRDLKPGNILVGSDTRLYVADFGLARMMGQGFEISVIAQSLSGARSLGDMNTAGGAKVATSSDRVGTFDYMSPEQREGREADARSDVFALGAILYELLTGRKVAGVPIRPSKARPGLNPVWDGIVYERCLTADPGERYGSAAELKAAILAATAPAPSPPPRAPGEEEQHKGAKIAKGRGPAWIGYAAAAALVVIVILGVIRGMRSRPGRQPETAEVVHVESPAPSVIPPPSAPAIRTGSIRILATVPPEAEAHFQGLEKRIRIGSDPWTVASTLPFVATGIPSGNVDVDLGALGYETTGGPRSTATVANGQTADVSFALSPLPAKLTVSCTAPGATVWLDGRELGPARMAIEVPALQTMAAEVRASGYLNGEAVVPVLRPGQDATIAVQLKATEPASPFESLRVQEVMLQTFKLRFMSRQKIGETVEVYQLNARTLDKTYFKKVGDQIEGYIVLRYEAAIDTLILTREGGEVRLPRGKILVDDRSTVRLVSEPDGKTFNVAINESFRLQGQKAQLVEIMPDGLKVRIRVENGGSEFIVSSTLPPEPQAVAKGIPNSGGGSPLISTASAQVTAMSGVNRPSDRSGVSHGNVEDPERLRLQQNEKEGLMALAAGLEAMRTARYQAAFEAFGLAVSNIQVRADTGEARAKAISGRLESALKAARAEWIAGRMESAMRYLEFAEGHPATQSEAAELRQEISRASSVQPMPPSQRNPLRHSGLAR